MKFRSSLLVACMVVVPALAMFSHLIPPGLRTAARRQLASLAENWLGTAAQAGTTATVPGAQPAAQLKALPPAPPADAGPLAPVAESPGNGGPPTPAASARPHLDDPPSPAAPSHSPTTARSGGGPPPAAAATVDVGTPALVAQMADRTRQARDQQARELQAIDAQLKALGAVAFDCQLVPGGDGLYSSGCRVPVDAAGQLQRVFQATGHDPSTAAVAVLEQVTSWRQRLGQPAASAPAAPPLPPAAAVPAQPIIP